MPLESASDLDGYFDPNSLGTLSTYTPAGGSSKTVNVIFENQYILVDEGEVGVNATIPVVTCKSSDVSGIAVDDTFLIDSVTYKVKIIRPDGTGVSEIQLEQQ